MKPGQSSKKILLVIFYFLFLFTTRKATAGTLDQLVKNDESGALETDSGRPSGVQSEADKKSQNSLRKYTASNINDNQFSSRTLEKTKTEDNWEMNKQGTAVARKLQITEEPTKVPTEQPSAEPTLKPTPVPTISFKPTVYTSSLSLITTIAGTGDPGFGGNGGPMVEAEVNGPTSVWVNTEGAMFICESGGKYIRKVGIFGIISIFAGTGAPGSGGDGEAATSAKLPIMGQITGDTMGTVYIAAFGIQKIRYVASGMMNLLAGVGSNPGYEGDDPSPATATVISSPYGVWADLVGNIFLSEQTGNKIRRIDSSGMMFICADRTLYPFLDGPRQLYGDTANNIYVANSISNYISVMTVTVNGSEPNANYTYSMKLFAGNGETDATVAGEARFVSINTPTGVWGDVNGVIYVSNDHRIYRIVDEYLEIVAGLATPSVSGSTVDVGDGADPALASFNKPATMFIDTVGSLYIADTDNHRIRKMYENAPTAAPTYTQMPTEVPTAAPTVSPSTAPTLTPTETPTAVPSTAEPSESPTMAPSELPTLTPSAVPTVVPTVVPTESPTETPTEEPTAVPSVVPSAAPTASPTMAPSAVPTVVPTVAPTQVPSEAPSVTPTAVPTVVPSAVPTITPSETPTNAPSAMPTVVPTVTPTQVPSEAPSVTPTAVPTVVPSAVPTITPSETPTNAPSAVPTAVPTISPTESPTAAPTESPTAVPTTAPTVVPTMTPSEAPTNSPTETPTVTPTESPTTVPSTAPTVAPSEAPTVTPSAIPTATPTVVPSVAPTVSPTETPTVTPTELPSSQPSGRPSAQPSGVPSAQPLVAPSSQPTCTPSSQPSALPSAQPTSYPSATPSGQPSAMPSRQPSSVPSGQPSRNPSCTPSTQPTVRPSSQPTCVPSITPSGWPSSTPSIQPSSRPSSAPTTQPSTEPSVQPSSRPTCQPSSIPSDQPSATPSQQPSAVPSGQPSLQPGAHPTSVPSVRPTHSPSLPLETPVTAKPTRLPTRRPTVSPTVTPSAAPSRTIPLDTSVSVVYHNQSETQIINTSNNSSGFQFVLPFLFVTPVMLSGLEALNVTQPTVGVNYLLLGQSNFTNNRIQTQELSYIYTPAVSYDFSGRSVAIAGDINGDGYDDLIIGVPFLSRCYVMFGTEHGFVNMTKGFTIGGTRSSDLTGWSVSGAGDVNNDTIADIIIGAPYAVNTHGLTTGAVYVIYGSRGLGNYNLYTDALSTSEGFTVYCVSSQDSFGLSVSGAGDMNSDGYEDIIVGALRQNSLYSGAAYILYGGAVNNTVSVAADTVSELMNAGRGVEFRGRASSWLGYSVSGAGDVNGDGHKDAIIGSVPRRFSGQQAPVSYVVFGSSGNSSSYSENPLNVATFADTLNTQQGVIITGGGLVVLNVGDLDRDSLSDVVLGANYGLTSGGGFVVQRPEKLPFRSSAPTFVPTPQPSVEPTLSPSDVPTMTPTQPTYAPTLAPSGPTPMPTMTPTQPTSVPSAAPTAPTLLPTHRPTVRPTVLPTVTPTFKPTAMPSVVPTVTPTVVRTVQPSTLMPTVTPTMVPTFVPSRIPHGRPTAVPTWTFKPTFYKPQTVPDLSNYTAVTLTTGGTVTRNPGEFYINFIVNSTEPILIIGLGEYTKFTILPSVSGVVTIERFNTTSDVLDLSAFPYLQSLADLNITEALLVENNGTNTTETAENATTIILPPPSDTTTVEFRRRAQRRNRRLLLGSDPNDGGVESPQTTGSHVNKNRVLTDTTSTTPATTTSIQINLPRNQRIILTNFTRTQVHRSRIVFFITPMDEDDKKSVLFTTALISIIIGSTVFMGFLMYVAYELINVYLGLSKNSDKDQVFQWDEIRKHNPTYMMLVTPVGGHKSDASSSSRSDSNGDSGSGNSGSGSGSTHSDRSHSPDESYSESFDFRKPVTTANSKRYYNSTTIVDAKNFGNDDGDDDDDECKSISASLCTEDLVSYDSDGDVVNNNNMYMYNNNNRHSHNYAKNTSDGRDGNAYNNCYYSDVDDDSSQSYLSYPSSFSDNDLSSSMLTSITTTPTRTAGPGPGSGPGSSSVSTTTAGAATSTAVATATALLDKKRIFEHDETSWPIYSRQLSEMRIRELEHEIQSSGVEQRFVRDTVISSENNINNNSDGGNNSGQGNQWHASYNQWEIPVHPHSQPQTQPQQAQASPAATWPTDDCDNPHNPVVTQESSAVTIPFYTANVHPTYSAPAAAAGTTAAPTAVQQYAAQMCDNEDDDDDCSIDSLELAMFTVDYSDSDGNDDNDNK